MSVQQRPRQAGAFDLRNVIAALLAIYGIILSICAFALDPGVDPDTGVAKAGMDNLWAGVVMVFVAVVFVLWAKLRPIVVEETHGDH